MNSNKECLQPLTSLFSFFFFELFTSFYKLSKRKPGINHRNWKRISPSKDERRYVIKELGVFFFRLYVFLIPDQEETGSISGITDSWLRKFDNQFWDWIQLLWWQRPLFCYLLTFFFSPLFFLFFFYFYFFFYDLIKFFDIVGTKKAVRIYSLGYSENAISAKCCERSVTSISLFTLWI